MSLVLLVLVGAVFDYGRAFYAAQQLERAARVAAREVALLPLPPAGISLQSALDCRRADVTAGLGECGALLDAPALPRETVFDPDFLAVPCSVVEAVAGPCQSDASLDDFFSRLPVVNQLLRPLMVFDRTQACADPAQPPCLLRYPGAVVINADPQSVTGYSVVIPVVVPEGGYRCVGVLEALNDSFAPGGGGGLVTLRLNYPFQAAALLGWRTEGGSSLPDEAADPGACAGLAGGLTPVNTLGALPVADADPNTGPYAGALGLGRQLALGRVVRPFRRVISSESSFRREVYL